MPSEKEVTKKDIAGDIDVDGFSYWVSEGYFEYYPEEVFEGELLEELRTLRRKFNDVFDRMDKEGYIGTHVE